MSSKFPRQVQGNVFHNSSTMSSKFPRQCLGNFLDIVEELIKTRCPDSSQAEMAKPDWYQRVSIDHFNWTIAGPTNWLVWAKEFLWHCPGIAKNISSKLSRKFPRHCRGTDTRGISELNSSASVFPRLEQFGLDNVRSSYICCIFRFQVQEARKSHDDEGAKQAIHEFDETIDK